MYVDPEYQEFLEFIAKPVENLPSAEIQLERKESERAGELIVLAYTTIQDLIYKMVQCEGFIFLV